MSPDPVHARDDVYDDATFSSSLILDPSDLGIVPDAQKPGEGAEGPASWVGKRLSHFKLLRPIGAGSMGRVIQALDVNLQRIVALKVLRKRSEGPEDQRRIDQFLREARAAVQIEHPGIVRIFEIGEQSGWWYLAMEMVEGQTLEEVIRAAGPLPIRKACLLLADAASALAVGHAAGVIHRDIKPSNIMLTRTGRGKITDFGLARINDPNDPFDFTSKSVGTPKYMAPESIQQKPADFPVDIYGLGGTLWYALTGRPPYPGKSVMEVLHKHLHEPPPNPVEHIQDCTSSMTALLLRMLDKNPAIRPTASEVAATLRAEAISLPTDGSGTQGSGSWGGPGGAPPAEGVGRRGARWVAVLTGVGLIGASLVVAVRYQDVNGTLVRLFPGAPAHYGVRGRGETPVAGDARVEPPVFSWVGAVDAGGAAYVASRRGRHYWRADDPRAVLIRAEDFVGYKIAEEAKADGKSPAGP